MSGHPLAEPERAPVFEEERGRLTLVEFNRLAFDPTRAYVIDAIPVGGTRAGHASRAQHRLLWGISGRALVTLDDGNDSRAVQLAVADTLQILPGTWLEIEALEERTAILVLADGNYDRSDIVTDRTQLPLA